MRKRPSGGGTRNKISKFTPASARRLTFMVRNQPDMETFVTLTYPGEYTTDGRQVKNHLRKINQWMFRKYGCRGIWLLEFQERGAPHFHIMMIGKVPKEELSRKWFEIVGSCDQRHLKAGTRIERIRKPHAAYVYCVSYIKKNSQKVVPEEYHGVGRFWGDFGGMGKPKKIVITDDALSIARVAKQGRKSQLRSIGLKVPKDNGAWSLTLYDCAGIVRNYAQDDAVIRLDENGPPPELVGVQTFTAHGGML